ncbi:uncharacterized protein METZ01_LOCUS159026 [marine metagenome]|uniref:Uncharacterized protein n=1 Tax=marine metagenome TaxID=408172 RepID=A0A382AYP1_9ZZZZ
MNDKTLAQQLKWFVNYYEGRSDCTDYGPKAQHEYGVIRNLLSTCLVKTKYAAKYAAEYNGSVKVVSK